MATLGDNANRISALAQGTSAQSLEELYLWLAAVAVLLVLIGIVGAWVLRRLRRPPEPMEGVLPFSLADLRRLRDQGHLTDEEYERARSRILAEVGRSAHASGQPTTNDEGTGGPD